MRKILFLLLIFLPSNTFGAAFLIYNQDTKANGMGMAAASSIDNPSAIFYNPALLVYQKGFGISMGDTIIIPDTHFDDLLTGKRVSARPKTHHLPNLYIKYTKDDLSFGVGMFSPFGLSTEWPKGWVGRYINTFAEIRTTYINPVIAYRVNSYLSFGLGLSFVKSSVTMKNAIDLSLWGAPDGIAKLTGDGDGIGYNVAITLKLPKQYTVSFTYRSPTEIKFNGKVRFSTNPLLKPFFPDGNASTEITFPFVAVAGVSKNIGPLTIEGDILYTGWSSLNSYKVKFDNGMPEQFYYKDWFNTPSIAIGANYQWKRSIEIRAGYMYDKSPVPKKTLGPELPDNTRNIFTLGTTYKKDQFKIDLGYQATFFKRVSSSRSITGLRGTYSNFAHLILLGLTYSR